LFSFFHSVNLVNPVESTCRQPDGKCFCREWNLTPYDVVDVSHLFSRGRVLGEVVVKKALETSHMGAFFPENLVENDVVFLEDVGHECLHQNNGGAFGLYGNM
jgi:hypothetical protein